MDTVVALLLPLVAGAVADRTALVATAGLFVRPLAVELSKLGCNDGAAAAGAAGAVAGGGCGIPTANEDKGCANGIMLLLLLVVPFVIVDGLLIGDEISGVEIECGGVIDDTDVLNPFANVVNG